MDAFKYSSREFENELHGDAHHAGEVAFLESIAAPGMTAMEIGANKGVTTVALSRAVGVKGRVYAFEPVPEYYSNLQENLTRNDGTNVSAFKIARGWP